MFSQPGRGDLILAEFKAKLLAGENPYPDPVEERMHRINRVVFRWGVLVTVVAALLGWVFDIEIAAIGSIVMIAVALLLTWRFRRRKPTPLASLSDQP